MSDFECRNCSCECHIRGIVGFFHCFGVCCDKPDVVLYQTEAEHAAAHPPVTREQAMARMADDPGFPLPTLDSK